MNCPECGATLSDNTEICPECGYNIASRKSDLDSNNKDPKTTKLEKRIMFDAKLDRIVSIIMTVIDIALPVLCVLFFVIAFLLERKISFPVAEIFVKAVFILLPCVSIPFTVICIIYELYATIGLKGWLAHENIDAKEYLLKYGVVSIDNKANIHRVHIDRLENLRKVAFMKDHPNEVICTIALKILNLAIRCFDLLPIVLIIMGVVDLLFAGEIETISQLVVGIIVSAVALYFVLTVIRNILRSLQKKRFGKYTTELCEMCK